MSPHKKHNFIVTTADDAKSGFPRIKDLQWVSTTRLFTLPALFVGSCATDQSRSCFVTNITSETMAPVRLLAPLRFLNIFEEQLLRHRRPRAPLSSEDSTMPRRVRKLPLDGSRLPVDDVSIFEYECARSDVRDDIRDKRTAVHLLHECNSRHRLNLSPKGEFRCRWVDGAF